MFRGTVRWPLAALVVLSTALPASAHAHEVDVVFVANAEDGTVSILDADAFTVLRTLDVIPDGDTPSFEQDPYHAVTAPFVTAAAGVNLAQDLDISPDGRTLYVSRGHRGDAAAFDIASGDMLWRVPVPGLRADHMAINADGSRLYLSDLTESTVLVVDTETAEVVGSFPTGEWAHESVISSGGERIYNGSIGNVLTPTETRNDRPQPIDDVLGEPYLLTVADPQTLEVKRTLPFARGIRPFVITDDETRMYAQLSEFHGVVEYDLTAGRMLRTSQLPIDEGVTEDDYDFEAPHHGIDISPDGDLLCAAGRASDYVALVSTETLRPVAIIDVDDAPSAAHNGPDGTHCFVANNRADTVSVISYESRSEVATVPVGDGPKHVDPARVPSDVL